LSRTSIYRTCVVIVVAAAAWVSVAGKAVISQTANQPAYSGTYKVSGANKLSGREEFKIARAGDLGSIETNGELTDAYGSRATRTHLDLNKGKLARYSSSATTGPAQRTYTIEFGPDSAQVKIESRGEKTERTLQVPADAVLIDNDVWAQYQGLLSRYDMAKKGVQNFTIFVPGGGLRVYNAQVEFEGSVSYKLHGENIVANNFVVMLADAYEVDIVADGTGVPLKAERYFDNKKAVLQ
jgi:hypothetical protein